MFPEISSCKDRSKLSSVSQTILYNYNLFQLIEFVNNKRYFSNAAGPDDEGRFLDQVRLFLGRAASKTDIHPDMYALIEGCNSVVRFNIPLTRDDGTIDTIACYRAQHSTH